MTGVQSFALPIFGLDGIFAACVARKNPLYTNMLIIDRQSSGSERVTRETAKALTRNNLDMDFGGAAIINDAASGERYEIERHRVGEGKMVSVRVDLGGRRCIKKKKKKQKK